MKPILCRHRIRLHKLNHRDDHNKEKEEYNRQNDVPNPNRKTFIFTEEKDRNHKRQQGTD